MTQLQVVEQKMVPFGNVELLAVKMSDGKIYAAVKWVCQGIGLTGDQTKNERKKIQTDVVLLKGGRNLTLPTNGGLQEVLCIELEFLPLWLAKISLTPTMQKESPWTVNNLVKFQLEVKDVLAKAFIHKQVMPSSIEDLIIMQAQSMKDVKQRLENVEKKQDDIVGILSLNPVEWRKKVNLLINKITEARGGEGLYRIVWNESYAELEERAKCNLNVRLKFKKQRMASEGVPVHKVDKANKMDVIAEDARLTEIYLAVVKDMAIKYQVNADGLGA